MNKLTTLGVPIYRLYIIVLFLLVSSYSFAQEETYTVIRKNVNSLAIDLSHDLSNTQDSLLLENKFLFKKVRFLNSTTEKVFDFKPAVKRAKIPLDQLPLGNYTVMFYQADKIIVFQIDRILPFDYKPRMETDVAVNELSVADLNMDIAMADINDSDLEFYAANLNLAINDSEDKFESLENTITIAYNLSNPNRSKVQSRAEYRRTHLRPNGKPYND
ncbi:hypothetical protein [Psychroserpens sp. MEBiC05023]